MKLYQRIAAIGVSVVAPFLLSTSSAQAQDNGLLSLLNGNSITLLCIPVGQAGQGNSVSGTQNINCSQSAGQTSTPPGQQGLTGYEVVPKNFDVLPQSLGVPFEADCPAGKKVTGGGIRWTGHSTDIGEHDNGPTNDSTGWVVNVFNTGNNTFSGTVYAICVNTGT
ncbi:hypothetical protein ACFZCP_03750 [Streptomyces sp. NPDC007971]|uniref:hypothetical protein n=1 Tax=Streptomyces sp. NPDC007971 TaxID=3364799 RepID=UPI0036E73BE6